MIQNCIPIPIPAFSYTMGGVALDTPLSATAPLLQGGNVMSGASFTLIFLSPSTATQNALASGATGTMLLAAHDGSQISGMVKVTSSSFGSLFLVTCAVLTLVAVNHAVIATQFY